MNRRSMDLFVVIAMTVIAMVVALTLPTHNLPDGIIALPLVLILPGYALTTLLFSSSGLKGSEKLLLSLGVSLVVTILIGLLLNLTPSGLQTSSWTLATGGITLLASCAALIRQQKTQVTSTGARPVGLSTVSAVMLAFAGLIVIGAMVFSYWGATQHWNSQGSAQLWLLPEKSTDQQRIVRLGVNNEQPVNTQYDLTVSVDGKPIQHWSAMNLKPNEQWFSKLTLPEHNGAEHVEVVLNRSSAPSEKYRYVDLWLDSQVEAH